MTTITDFPALRPSQLLDFANSGRVDPRISCVRVSTATFCGPDGKRRTVASNVPRIDYDPVTGKCLGLLVEEARTNFILNSGDLSQSAWAKSRATATAPDADGFSKVVEDGSNNSHYVSQTVTLTASDRVVRLLVKAGERTRAQIEFTGNAGNAGRRVVVDLVAGTVLSNSLIGSGGLVASSVSARLIGAGVTELTMQVTPTATTGATANLLIILHDGTGVTYQGDGVSGIYAKEVQVEAGVFPTSYIPTDAAAVTRAAENIQLAELGSWYRRESGTWVVDYMLAERTLSGTETIICASHKTENSRLQVRAGVVAARNAAGTLFETVIPATGAARIATTYGGGKSSTAKSGVLYPEANYATPVDAQRLHLGVIDTSWAGYWLNGYITRIAYIPAQLTRAQLQRVSAT